jgi:hypothetical protein
MRQARLHARALQDLHRRLPPMRASLPGRGCDDHTVVALIVADEARPARLVKQR